MGGKTTNPFLPFLDTREMREEDKINFLPFLDTLDLEIIEKVSGNRRNKKSV